MKKLFVLLFVATLSLQSCKKDDDAPAAPAPTPSELIIGKWKLVSIEENGVPENLDECELTSNIEFTSDTSTSIYMEKKCK